MVSEGFLLSDLVDAVDQSYWNDVYTLVWTYHGAHLLVYLSHSIASSTSRAQACYVTILPCVEWHASGERPIVYC